MFNKFTTTLILGSALGAQAQAAAPGLAMFGSRDAEFEIPATILGADQNDHSENDDDQKQSHFDQLAGWYEAGGATTFEDVRGSWSGRCFERVAKTKPINSLMSTHEKDEVGPGFDSLRHIVQLVYRNGVPSFFDDYDIITDSANSKQVVKNYIASKRITAISDVEGTLSWTTDFEPNGNIDMQYGIRKHDDFFVVQGKNLINGNIILSDALGKRVRDVTKGDWSYCYYFKDLTEQ